jgi:antitoxin (DNA-binding transcriptional repressor) of toxin-antitoxin stability system
MMTISVSSLKAHLCAELRKVEAGESLVILDHRRPVARLVPAAEESIYSREARQAYACPKLSPLMRGDPLEALAAERGERC